MIEREIPAIVSPVAKSIPIRNAKLSAEFYRRVLRFERLQELGDFGNPHRSAIEMIRGPVRIQLSLEPAAPVIVFLETDDVIGMHLDIANQGGNPSEIQQVNQLQQTMFEVRDPDGNVLWFGKPLGEPGATEVARGDGAPFLEKAIPEFVLDRVSEGQEHYEEVLGFSVNYSQSNLAILDRDNFRLLLTQRTDQEQGTGSAYVYVRRVDDLYEELKAKGANVVGDVVSRPWGLREFHVLDPEGNHLTFAQTFE
jgi:uncharacterized glyoxalase superfamily protein PhnB